jgi:hypothetical protein
MMSNYYHDDPVTPPEVQPNRRKRLLAAALLLFSCGLYVNTTLAANINIGTGGKVEFGQGMTVAASCAGSSVLTVTPSSSFVNVSGSGDFYFNSITVSGIPSSCNGADFQISVYDSTTSTALPIFGSSKTIARIWSDGGTFKLGSGSVSGAAITSSSGAFTVSFNSPSALATRVSRLTFQSVSHIDINCATDFICAPGDTGPGGGTVFYVNSQGFNCGPDHTATGSPTGGLCNYLEFAPATWSGGAADPKGKVTTSASNIAVVGVAVPRTLSEIGRGYKYSNAINAVFGNCSAPVNNASGVITNCPTVAAAARAYLGRGLNDWYLPNAAELNVACQYGKGQTINPAVGCASSEITPVGFVGDDYFTSTASSTNLDRFYSLHMRVANSFQQMTGYGFDLWVKPIRAF